MLKEYNKVNENETISLSFQNTRRFDFIASYRLLVGLRIRIWGTTPQQDNMFHQRLHIG